MTFDLLCLIVWGACAVGVAILVAILGHMGLQTYREAKGGETWRRNGTR